MKLSISINNIREQKLEIRIDVIKAMTFD